MPKPGASTHNSPGICRDIGMIIWRAIVEASLWRYESPAKSITTVNVNWAIMDFSAPIVLQAFLIRYLAPFQGGLADETFCPVHCNGALDGFFGGLSLVS